MTQRHSSTAISPVEMEAYPLPPYPVVTMRDVLWNCAIIPIQVIESKVLNPRKPK
jgi:hypothetical protein